MAEKLSITIGLEGGAELQRQLADIGKAGQQAFLDIAKAAEKAGGFQKLKPEEVTAKLEKMGITGAAALNKIQAAVAGAVRIEQLVGIAQKVENGFAGMASAAGLFVRALGPISIAAGLIGLAFAGIAKAVSNAAEAISKVDQAAIKAGLSIEKFDQLRAGFQAMGMSAKGVEQAMQGIAAAADAAKLTAVTQAIENLAKASSDFGTAARARPADLMALQQAAEGVGPAADKAREALQQFGTVQIPGAAWVQALGGTAQTLQDFIARTGDAVTGTAQFVESLRQMPDSANRSALAIAAFKDAGTELVQALRTGAITEDQFKERLGGLTQGAANTAASFEQSSNRMAAALERAATSAVWDTFGSSGTTAINSISGALDGLIEKLSQVVKLLGQVPSSGGGAPASPPPGLAGGGLLGGRGSGTSDSNLAWVSRGEYVMPAGAVRQSGVLALLESLRGGRIPGFAAGGLVGGSALGVMDSVRRMIIAVGKSVAEMTFAVIDPIESVLRSFSDSSQRLLNSLSEADQALAAFLRAQGGLARGGLLGGRGTGTSDSNLAWVSRGEHIMPAAIVRQPGVLALLEALRRGGDLTRLLDGIGHFATGGLVGMSALAGGGVVGMSHVTIAFPGLPEIGGLRASSAVVEQLQRAAAMAQVRSGGRKPSRYT